MGKITKSLSAGLTLFIIHYSLFPALVRAVCPVCTVAVVAGLGLSRWFGVDDTVSGTWIGGALLSFSLWFFSWLGKKYPKVETRLNKYLVVILVYAITLVPLAWTGVIGHPFNTLWGIDKLVLGVTFGSVAFLIGVWADKKVRKIKGKQLFNFQKVIIPISLLIIVSLLMYFYGGYLK